MVPLEERRFCPVPFTKVNDMDWGKLMEDTPGQPSNDGLYFFVKYDDRKGKPECLSPFPDYSYPEVRLAGKDPDSIWYRGNDPEL